MRGKQCMCVRYKPKVSTPINKENTGLLNDIRLWMTQSEATPVIHNIFYDVYTFIWKGDFKNNPCWMSMILHVNTGLKLLSIFWVVLLSLLILPSSFHPHITFYLCSAPLFSSQLPPLLLLQLTLSPLYSPSCVTLLLAIPLNRPLP